ncbi:TlpA family protein disulfide reductase [Nitratiruptor sp. SB155-2]|uniref:TlpA family protein disulfide reductase n=1 Tax=Nitratiruptor sp. (strain SB155-2) TaxID=387092 RepID=UPI0001587390|nr:TlpA disulfide reductase family protein [Nitratiruptor sp. SB155-2]BAF70165.1 lipoprotein thiredoxin [Nitratiruptor sp. SB155-2]
MQKLLLPLLILMLLTGCTKKEEKQKKVSQPIEKAVKKETPPVYTFHDTNDKTRVVKIVDDKFIIPNGKNIEIFIFFATWCPSCKAEIPELNELYKTFKTRIDIVALPLDGKNLDTFIQTYNMKYFVSRTIDKNLQFAKKVYAMLQAGANMPIPLTLVLQNGKYYIHYIGAVPYEVLNSDIKKALGE